MKTKLSTALKSRYETLPEAFERRVDATLQTFKDERNEPVIHKRMTTALVLIAALLLVTMGVALALNAMGILDFRKEDTGRAATPEVAAIVQRDFKNNVAQLGDCTVTVREAISDGLSGNLMVEYRLPEGMYLYCPDSRTPGKYHSAEAETPETLKTVEDLLKIYPVLYMPMDEHIGYFKDDQFKDCNGYGWDAVKTADNVNYSNIAFSVDQSSMADFVYCAGVFRITTPNSQEWERLTYDNMNIGMYMSTDSNFQKTGEVPQVLKEAGVQAITVTFTPLSMVVDVEGSAFEVVDENGQTIGIDFLSCEAVTAYDEASGMYSAGYTCPEVIPETLYIQLYDTWSRENTIGGIVQVTLK